MRLPRFLIIGKYELKQHMSGHSDKTTFVFATILILLMLAIPQSQDSNLPSARGIYKVGILPDSPISSLGVFQVKYYVYPNEVELIYANNMNEIDAFVINTGRKISIYGSGTQKADASLTRLHELVQELNSYRAIKYMQGGSDLEGVFFPIRVSVIEEEINYTGLLNASVDHKKKFLDLDNKPPEKITIESPPTSSRSGDGVTAEEKEIIGFDPSTSGSVAYLSQDLPSNLDTGFPFEDLYRNMSYLTPFLMFSMLFALSLSRERVENNIENLFTSPLTRTEILLGKASPYIVSSILISVGISLKIGSGLDIFKIFFIYMSLAVVMLSFSLYAMLASRSYRELTFIGSFSLFTFFFFIVLPNVFSGVNVLAYISPLDLTTSIQYGADVSISDIFFSLLPYNTLSIFFLSFTWICFHAEVIYGNYGIKRLFKEFYSRLSSIMGNPILYVLVAITLLVPFIYIVESIVAYLIMPLGFLAPLLSMAVLVVIEELVKILPLVYRRMNPILYSITAGTGFFLAEKLFNIYLITKVYEVLGGPYMLYVLKGALFTWLIHIISVLPFAILVHYGRKRLHYLLGFMVAFTIHLIYNITIIYGV